MQKTSQPEQQKKPENEHQKYLDGHLSDILNFEETDKISELLDHLQKYVDECGKDITTHQIRNIFSKIKRDKMKTAQQLQLIRPQLAYAAARQATSGAKDFVNFLEKIIREVRKDEQVKHIIAFFEAIVAYHKLYHGNKK